MTVACVQIFAVFTFFPYVRIAPIPSDIQPNAMCFGLLLILAFPAKLKSVPLSLYLYALAAVLIGLIPGGEPIHRIRGVVSNLSFALTFIGWYVLPYDLIKRAVSWIFLESCLLIYLLGVLLQRFIDPELLTIFISRSESYGAKGGRGNESFAAEPTFFAIQILLILCFVYAHEIGQGWRKWVIYATGLVLIVWGSKSSTAILVIGVLLATYLLIYLVRAYLSGNIIKVVKLAAIAGAVAILIVIVWSGILGGESRFAYLYGQIQGGPLIDIISSDESLGDRFGHVYFSIRAAFADFLVPHGYGVFYPRMVADLMETGWDLKVTGLAHGRVMSFIGGLLFECGWFGLIPLYLIGKSIQNIRPNAWTLAVAVALGFLLLQSVPISNPIIALIAAVGYGFHHKQRAMSVVGARYSMR